MSSRPPPAALTPTEVGASGGGVLVGVGGGPASSGTSRGRVRAPGGALVVLVVGAGWLVALVVVVGWLIASGVGGSAGFGVAGGRGQDGGQGALDRPEQGNDANPRGQAPIFQCLQRQPGRMVQRSRSQL